MGNMGEHFIVVPDNDEAVDEAIEDLNIGVDLCGFLFALAKKEEVPPDELLLNLRRG